MAHGALTAVILTALGGTCVALTSSPLFLDGLWEPTVIAHHKQDDRMKYAPESPCTPDQANEILRWESNSIAIGKGSTVLRYDDVSIPSNSPVEDQLMLAQCIEDEELKWLVIGIYDGHAGSETSVAIQHTLIHNIIRRLQAIYSRTTFTTITSEAADQAITKAFLDLDREIIERGAQAALGPTFLTDALSELGPGYAGSCALISFYNSDTQVLKVACAGDSRAVLGRRNAAGKWEAKALSVDQTGFNKNEVARLSAEHPNEPGMIKDGRLLGRAVTRAFGDGRWKWSREVQEKARDRYFGPALPELLLTPPYLTAEPVITTTKIEPDKGDFLIMASDGLWDNLSNQQAVDLVGRWLEQNDPAKEAPRLDLSLPPPSEASPQGVPTRKNPDTAMAYTRTARAREKDFVVVDRNAAVHLLRNSLGGGNEDWLCGMLTPRPPLARKIRDDATIQVIFFGDDPTTIENF